MKNRAAIIASCWFLGASVTATASPPLAPFPDQDNVVAPPQEGIRDRPLTLEAVIALALARNPILQSQEERRREVSGGVREARADAFPQWTVTTGWNIARDPSLLNSEDFEDILASFPGGNFEPARQELFDITTEVRQPLFTWGKLGAAVRLAHTVSEVTEAQIDTVRLDTALEATEAFFEILAARQQILTLESQQHLRREELSLVETRLELGDATRLEMLRAKASWAQVSPGLETAKGDEAVALSRLRRVLGLPRDHPLEVADSSSPLPQPPAAAVLRQAAFRSRTELLDLEKQQEALDLRIRIIRSEGKPRLDLAGSYGRTARLAEDLGDHQFRDWRLALDFHWDLFDGGRRRGQIEQFESQKRQLAFRRQDLENQIEQEIDESVARLVAALARWQAAELSAEASREAVRVAEEGYREGVALQVDLLGARDQETEALQERSRAYFDAQIRWARLLRASGRLPASHWKPTRPTPRGEESLGDEAQPKQSQSIRLLDQSVDERVPGSVPNGDPAT
ncbi:MAG: TolC family protein [Deltaproteobacteria bacterium]|nr:TolC family protein [Deltaproteobacteria bacterium]